MSQESISSRLKKNLLHYEILFEKGLHSQCETLLSRIKEEAIKSENYIYLMGVHDWEYKLASSKPFEMGVLEKLKNIYQEVIETVDIQKNIFEYRNLSTLTFQTHMEDGSVRDKEQLGKIDALLNSPLMKSDTMATSISAKIIFYVVHANCYRIKGDLEKTYFYRKKIIELYKANPNIINKNFNVYLTAVMILIAVLPKVKRYKEMEETIKDLKLEIENSKHKLLQFKKDQVIGFLYHCEIQSFIEQGEFLNANVKFKEGMKLLPHFNINIINNFSRQFYVYGAYVNFGLNDYSEALRWSNLFLNEAVVKQLDLLCSMKILNLIIHFELGNDEYMDHITKSTYKFLYKKHRVYKFEGLVLNYMRKLPEITNHRKRIDEFKLLRNEFIELSKDPFEKKAFENFDFISWIESKIENRNFADIVKEKAIHSENH